jgi:8-hydroxy-5-deazaflavin:NADPH oxidoreductase
VAGVERKVVSVRIGILGTGGVGRSMAEGLTARGHEVTIGTRSVEALMARTEPDAMGNEPYAGWRERNPEVGLGTFAGAAAHGELVVNATNGMGSLDALRAAGKENLDGKVLIDVSNPLDFSRGMPPSLFVSNTDSLGEQIQREFPEARVVKTLNTVASNLMVEPSLVAGGDHTVFMSGDDQDAKARVGEILRSFGWRHIVDLGDLTTARGAEMYVAMWVRLWQSLGTPVLNVKVVQA